MTLFTSKIRSESKYNKAFNVFLTIKIRKITYRNKFFILIKNSLNLVEMFRVSLHLKKSENVSFKLRLKMYNSLPRFLM